MKKFFLLMIAFFAVVALASCVTNEKLDNVVAMITDYGDITDQSFNQATYEGCKDWCKANKVGFKYFKPVDNSDAERIKSTEKAIDEGFSVIVMPGYAFAPTVEAVAAKNPDVKFVALDVSLGDLLAAHFPDYNYDPTDERWASYQLPANVYCATYAEEVAGYFAGYAAVKEGYTKLGFLGGMSVPAVIRYGYGFVQGCNAAAEGKEIEIKYVYGGQFFGDADITAVMDTWYGAGTQVVFACGGGIYTSACDAALKVGGKVIGVDVDQSGTIKTQYDGKVECVTSAMKGLYATVQTQLENIINKENFVSTIENLGLVSATETDKNYVQLPTASWSMKNYTVEQYKELVGKIYRGEVVVSNDITAEPTVAATTKVDYQGNIK